MKVDKDAKQKLKQVRQHEEESSIKGRRKTKENESEINL